MIREGVMISNRYEIMGRIGTGGMADVYKAIDRKLNRYVAVKVLKREFREDETFVNKFQTEAQSAAGLQHPNIVSIYDVGEDRGLYYIVMELIEGITLKDYIQKKGRLTPKEVISIGVQVCSAMEMAHGRNIIHRDIKPQNIMISKEGKVKVTDFGIAKATSSNTISTNAMGSVHYTSPEQARGGFSDAKSDIYSLGISMYEMITGKLPFDGDSTVSIALKHLQEDIIPPSELVPKIPYSLEQIILKCTQKSPDRRYADIGQLERDLRRSLVEPDGDFVVIAPFTGSATKMITPEELSQIHKASGYDEFDDDYTFDDDDDEYEKRRAKWAEENEVDPKMNKVMKILTIVAAVLFLVVLIFVGGRIFGLFGNGSENSTDNGKKPSSSEMVKVPSLEGMTKKDAEKACEKAGLKLGVRETKEPSRKYEKDHVTRQTPETDAKTYKGSTVMVWLSSGLEVQIPDVANKKGDSAKSSLEKDGFEKVTIKEEYHSTVKEGNVIRTEPGAGEWHLSSDELVLVVSKGPIKMPNLVALKYDTAKKKLEELGLKVKATYETSETVEKDVVIRQTVTYDTIVEAGTEIELVVSSGKPEKATVPTNLLGKSLVDVKKKLEELGFKVESVEDTNNQYAAGQVCYVEYAGQERPKGSTINIIVSTGDESGNGEN